MNYKNVTTIDEAITFLVQGQGNARIIGGGTDLVIDIQEGKTKAELLVDISRVAELGEIKVEGDRLLIGSAVTLTTIARSPLVQQYAPSLVKAASSVGALQIRNVATLVGNVITAQPAADGAMALSALGASFLIQTVDGVREVPLVEMYAGFGKSTIDSSKELVIATVVPCQKEMEASEFVRLELRKSLALPMLNVGVMARVEDGKCAWVRISMGPVGVGPKRATTAEQWFAGKEFTKANIKEAAKMSLQDANPRSNPLRGSKDYREQTLPVLIERGLLSVAKQLNIDLV